MKPFWIILWLPMNLFGQGHFVGFGYSGYFGNYDNIHYVIDRYNETRSYLDKEMDGMKVPKGLSFQGAYFLGPNVFFDMGVAGRKSYSHAYGTDQSGILTQRDLRLKTVTFGASLGVGSFPLYLGTGLFAGLTTISSKVGERNKIDVIRFQRINRDPYADIPIFITYCMPFDKEDASTLGLQIKTGVRLPLIKSDVADMNEAINPITHKSDPADQLISRHTSFEFTLILGFFGMEK